MYNNVKTCKMSIKNLKCCVLLCCSPFFERQWRWPQLQKVQMRFAAQKKGKGGKTREGRDNKLKLKTNKIMNSSFDDIK